MKKKEWNVGALEVLECWDFEPLLQYSNGYL
jgi:hypothetical protein